MSGHLKREEKITVDNGTEQIFNLFDVSDSHYSSNPKYHNITFETWDELFQFQASKDGANYTMLKDWLKKFCEVPKLKNK